MAVDCSRRVSEGEPTEVSLTDTIGVAVSPQVAETIGRVREALHTTKLRGHFHNTRNSGLANALAALESGVTTLGASTGGIGDCPFAPAATGNVPTEDREAGDFPEPRTSTTAPVSQVGFSSY